MGSIFRRKAMLVALAMTLSACMGDVAPTSTTGEIVTTPGQSSSTTSVATTSTEAAAPDPCDDHKFCVLYEIRPEAAWSDGRPVVAADFVHTFEEIVSSSPQSDGYASISAVTPIDDRTVLVGFSEIYAPWRTLFDVILPNHVSGPTTVPGSPVTGPFVLDEWIEGERLVLRRNPRYWSDQDPVSDVVAGDVEEIVFVFLPDVRDQLEGLEDDEVDVIAPRPLDWMIEELSQMPDVMFDLAAGPFWEHVDFNHDDVLLSQSWVREALAMGIDRERIMDETIRLIDPGAVPLDSAIWLGNSTHYRDNYDHVFDPEMAESLLRANSCEPGEDGIYVCQGRRMSFVWATTAGDEVRQKVYDIAFEGLQGIGIELVLDARTPSELFSSEIFFAGPSTWQLINFSWKGEPDPHLANSTFYCRGDAPHGFGALNVNRYCDQEVDSLVRSTERIFEADERIAAYTEADAAYLDDQAIIPLFQRPLLLAWNDGLEGPSPIATGNSLWNVAAWAGQSTVVVALGAEPDSLDPLSLSDEEGAAVISSMLHGAFAVDPSMDFVPVLVSEATPMLGGG